ncbi:MAG: class I SAM-dependent methyltransferase [Flavobacteriaceae bacterium]
MLQKALKKIKDLKKKKKLAKDKKNLDAVLKSFVANGSIPWSPGYAFHKKQSIIHSISNSSLLEGIRNKQLPEGFGYRLDERVIEYAWIFANLTNTPQKMLDAGSTFNFNYLVKHPHISNKELTIFTYAPEEVAFYKNRISYVFGDLREMYFKDAYFDLVVSQSTIEHIDMDNSMYGYELEHNQQEDTKSYEYLKAISEMFRVLKSKGTLLLTFPFGAFEHHGFFQQFDQEMLSKITQFLEPNGTVETTFFTYEPQGWRFAQMEELDEVVSHNPHTGKGFGKDYAAHSRAVACIKFIKH